MKHIIIIAVLLAIGLGIYFGFSSKSANVDQSGNGQVAQAVGITLPAPTNYAVDEAGALSPDELSQLNATLKSVDDGKHQLAVVIVKSTQPMSIEQFGIAIAEKWKVGYRGEDTGAIIILATEDRKARIEIGTGLEPVIPDSVAGTILRDKMIPFLKEDKWFAGIMAGIGGLEDKLK